MLHHWWGYIFLFHLMVILNHRDQFTPEEVLLWIFFFDSWRRFYVVLRIKGRIKEPCIKKDSKGAGGWEKKKTMEKETLEISAAGFG